MMDISREFGLERGAGQISLSNLKYMGGAIGSNNVYIGLSNFLGRGNDVQEYPPIGIPSAHNWTKDTSDTFTGLNSTVYPKYKAIMSNTAAAYGDGQYVAYANTILAGVLSTQFDGSEHPPSGAFDKYVIGNNDYRIWAPAGAIYYSGVDADPPAQLYIQVPNRIILRAYSVSPRADNDTLIYQYPTKWNVYGSSNGTNFSLIESRSNVSWGTMFTTLTFTIASNVEKFNTYRFDFLRNNRLIADYMSVGDIRLFSSDYVPSTSGKGSYSDIAPGAIIHLDANVVASYTSVNSGSRVWSNISTVPGFNTLHATQSLSSNPPTLRSNINGYYLDFSASSKQYYKIPTFTINYTPSNTGNTFIVVGAPEGNTLFSKPFDFATSTSANTTYNFYQSNNNYPIFRMAGNFDVSVSNVSSNIIHIYTIVIDNTPTVAKGTSYMMIDGAYRVNYYPNTTSPTFPDTDTFNNNNIGKGWVTDGEYYLGTMNEFLWFPRRLDDKTLKQLHSRIAQKWNITLPKYTTPIATTASTSPTLFQEILHFDANYLATVQGFSSNSAVPVWSNVASDWRISATHVAASNTTSSERPILGVDRTGYYVEFAASNNHRLRIPTIALTRSSNSPGFTVVYVGSFSNSQPASAKFLNFHAGATGNVNRMALFTPLRYNGYSSGGTLLHDMSAGVNTNDNMDHIYMIKFDSVETTPQFYVDGKLISYCNNTTPSIGVPSPTDSAVTYTHAFIGSMVGGTTADSFNGKMRELLFFPSYIDDTYTTQLNLQLADKYKITAATDYFMSNATGEFLHFDANYLANIQGQASGQPISVWSNIATDLTTRSNNLLHATASNRISSATTNNPTLERDTTAKNYYVSFDVTKSNLFSLPPFDFRFNSYAPGLTIVAVSKFKSVSSSEVVFDMTASDFAYYSLSRRLGTNTFSFQVRPAGTGGVYLTARSAEIIDTNSAFHIYTVRYNRNDVSSNCVNFFKNGRQISVETILSLPSNADTVLPYSAITASLIGASSDWQAAPTTNADLKELIVYNKWIDDIALTNLHNSLAQKWKTPSPYQSYSNVGGGDFLRFDANYLGKYLGYSNESAVSTWSNIGTNSTITSTSLDLRAMTASDTTYITRSPVLKQDITGNYYINFAGSNSGFINNNSYTLTLDSNSPGITIAAVARSTRQFTVEAQGDTVISLIGNNSISLYKTRTSGSNILWFLASPASATYYQNVFDNRFSICTCVADNKLNSYASSVLSNGYESSVYIDGAHVLSEYTRFALSNSNTINTTYVGYGAYSLVGDIGEIIVFNRALTSTQLHELHRQLAEKWKINLNVSPAAALPSSGLPVGGETLRFDAKWLSAYGGYNNNDVVYKWRNIATDQSIGITEASGCNNPILSNDINGPMVKFVRSSSQYFQIPTMTITIDSNAPGLTAFAVARFTNLGNFERIFDFGNGSAASNIVFCRQSTNSNMCFHVWDGGVQKVTTQGSNVITDASFHVYHARLENIVDSNSNVAFIGKDGTTNIVTSSINNTFSYSRTLTQNLVGRSLWAGDANLEGDIRELVFYPRKLTDNEMLSVSEYLTKKWNIRIPTPYSSYNYGVAGDIIHLDANYLGKVQGLSNGQVVSTWTNLATDTSQYLNPTNINAGTSNSPVLSNDGDGYCVKLVNANKQWITVPPMTLTFDTARPGFTAIFVAKSDRTVALPSRIFNFGAGGNLSTGNADDLHITNNTYNTLNVHFLEGNILSYNVSSADNYLDNNLHIYTIVKDNSTERTVTFMRDNVIHSRGIHAIQLKTTRTLNTNFIGAWSNDAGSNTYQGDFREFMFYRRRLTMQELQTIHTAMALKWHITIPAQPNAQTPPITSGLVGYYTPESWTGTQWTDLSGSGNHATTYQGTITRKQERGVQFLYGSTTAGIIFPSAILPSTYTLFHVARYNGANRQRIFDASDTNWFSGFHNLKAGIAYHNAWLTSETDLHGSNWVISTDQNDLYRSQFVQRSTSGGWPSFSYGRLSVNYGQATTERSDWACAGVLVYNTTLSAADIVTTENWISRNFICNYSPANIINTGIDLLPLMITQSNATYYPQSNLMTLVPGVASQNGYAILPVNFADTGNVFRIEFEYLVTTVSGVNPADGINIGVSSTYNYLGATGGTTILNGNTAGVQIGINLFPDGANANDNTVLFYMKSATRSQRTKLSSLNLSDGGGWKNITTYFDFNQMRFRVVTPSNNDISYSHSQRLTPDGNIIYIAGRTGGAYATQQIRNVRVYNSWI